MKYAVISDIHSNIHAFKALLKDLREKDIKNIINLGDIVGYGANPVKCLETVMYMDGEEVDNIDNDLKKIASGFKIYSILGNHDAGVINFTDLSYFNRMAYESILWTRKKLKFKHISYLKKLKYCFDAENKFYFYHSTPTQISDWKYLTDKSSASYYFKSIEKDYFFVGHTHVLKIFIYNKNSKRVFKKTPEKKHWELKDNYKYIINPGSIGQPRDGNYMPSYIILDTKRNYIDVHRVDYDVKKAERDIIDAGLPYFLAERLSVGK